MTATTWCENLKGRDYMGEAGIGGMIILKRT
jgi:hypothetical protein